jgi:hypothetical protein
MVERAAKKGASAGHSSRADDDQALRRYDRERSSIQST